MAAIDDGQLDQSAKQPNHLCLIFKYFQEIKKKRGTPTLVTSFLGEETTLGTHFSKSRVFLYKVLFRTVIHEKSPKLYQNSAILLKVS